MPCSRSSITTPRKRRAERLELNFEKCQQQIDKGFADTWNPSMAEAEQKLIVEELRLNCLQGLLQCLNRKLRMTYALGEIFEMKSQAAAQILDITPEAFRQRLSRARKLMRNFMLKNCGLIHAENP